MEASLAIAVVLVVIVVFLFLRDLRAVLIPAVAVPVSLIGTFAAMYLLNYSIDNLSLMALTVATGFVVDDAIVVMENIVRNMEAGVPRFEAAIIGVGQVGFTVLSMSLSLIAVFIPILLMGGVVGLYFREFAVTLSVAILISMVVSLTTTPMMCARLLSVQRPIAERGRFYRWSEETFETALGVYRRTLAAALRHRFLTIIVLVITVVLNVWLFAIIPKGFFPEQDTGRMFGFIQADQSISFQRMSEKLKQYVAIIQKDPDVDNVVGFTGAGGGGGNGGRMFIQLKDLGIRKASTEQIMARLRPQLAHVPGSSLFMMPAQEVRVGGRMSYALYQYTLQSDSLEDLRTWTPKLLEALKQEPILSDLNSDQQDHGLETDLVIDRDTASRMGLTAIQIDNTLYDAFGQRTVSTIYKSLNQYHVVMVVQPRFWQEPEALKQIFVSSTGGVVTGTQSTNAVAGTVTAAKAIGASTVAATSANSVAADTARNASINAIATTGHGAASTGQAVSTGFEKMVPLSAFSHYELGTTPLAVNHQGPFVAGTILVLVQPTEAPNSSISGTASPRSSGRPPRSTCRRPSMGASRGPRRRPTSSRSATSQVLILAAIVAIYLVLGILYESYAHPFTILSTLPSAGIGAVLGRMRFNVEFSLIALIGVFLLIGIVKKNAIMMIDFAIEAERTEGLSPRDAIFKACLLRFKADPSWRQPWRPSPRRDPAGPRAMRQRSAEMRQPLGIAIVGGLILSQLLTLYTTPVVYLYVDQAHGWWFSRSMVRLGHPRPRPSNPCAPARMITYLKKMQSPKAHRSAGPKGSAVLLGAAVLALAAGCAVGPDFKRPVVANVPAAFKEDAGWKVAAPDDGGKRGPWWEAFGDPVLDKLESQVETSNQNVLAALANYEAARQIVHSDRTGYLPTVSVDGSATRSRAPSYQSAVPGSATASGRGYSMASNLYSADLQASWAPDIWGKLRRTVEADVATAQANAADLASAILSMQATLAEDYIGLRAADDKIRLLEGAVSDYSRTLRITRNKYAVGVSARSDIITAQTQLDSTRAQLVDAGVQRAQYEHALAVLVGQGSFRVLHREDAHHPGMTLPSIPAQLASTLLERRPDIAAAERQVAAANAKRSACRRPRTSPDPDSFRARAASRRPTLDKLISAAPYKFWTIVAANAAGFTARLGPAP